MWTKAKSYIKEGEQWQTRDTKIKEAANNPAVKAAAGRRAAARRAAVSKPVAAEVAAARAADNEAVAAAKAVTAN